MAALDELPHGARQDAWSSLGRRRRLVAGRAGQLVHADDAVLDGKRSEVRASASQQLTGSDFLRGAAAIGRLRVGGALPRRAPRTPPPCSAG